ncbi:hypothetical protein [Pontibacter burrus]|uniref:Uncharacterized protein n=1 Tax=Pontibacter burrus TaxID=2704466 RepID=A0A6B3LQG1_9BACT|nr:hypothetical protein [Pontibacter burrus]NEM98083.1 hypothetical protein [Pontibacter burrus]
MNKIANRIKLNNNLWFTILGNKLVFGYSFLSKGFHYTFSFGNKSGIFDLHLTNSKGEHYTVLEISHQNIYEVLPILLVKIKKSVFVLSNFEESKCNSEDFTIYKIEQYSDVTSELRTLTKKNKIIIDKDSSEFKSFVEKLTETQSTRIIKISDLKNEPQFLGIVKSKTECFFIMKSPFLEDQVFRINNIDLDINSVFEKILGKEVYETILNRINDGILQLQE